MPKFIKLSSGLFVNLDKITCIDPDPGYETIWIDGEIENGIKVTEGDIIRISDHIECITPCGFID